MLEITWIGKEPNKRINFIKAHYKKDKILAVNINPEHGKSGFIWETRTYKIIPQNVIGQLKSVLISRQFKITKEQGFDSDYIFKRFTTHLNRLIK